MKINGFLGMSKSAFAQQLWVPSGCILVLLMMVPALALGDTVMSIDFAGEATIPTQRWLGDRGFELKRHAKDPDKIELFHREQVLHIVAKAPAFGMLAHEMDVAGAKRLRLHWGVSDYPEGVSYQHGVDNEAIMVYVFFGNKKMPSGEFLIPDSPYFIGFYLCQPGTDQTEQPYAGHHYLKTGRFICVDHPPEGEAAVSEVDLDEEFSKSFGISAAPFVSGISIEVDTTDADNDGHAAAFLRRIEFLD
jgi:hypothetical protein